MRDLVWLPDIQAPDLRQLDRILADPIDGSSMLTPGVLHGPGCIPIPATSHDPRVYVLETSNAPGSMSPRHPKKQVEAALKRAERAGMRVDSPRAHWGVLYCPGDDQGRCPPFSINGSPRNPDNEARRIDRWVARCVHKP